MKETPSNNIDSLSYAERLAAKKLIKQQLQREGLPTAFQLQRFTSLSKTVHYSPGRQLLKQLVDARYLKEHTTNHLQFNLLMQ